MRIKRLILIMLILIPISIYSLEYPEINSKIIEIYDLNDNKILYDVKSNEVVSVASLTKIATAMVAIENIKNLDESVVITKDILKTVDEVAHVIGLKKGDRVTYRDLLYGTLVASGADAANALAILSSGSISNHVKKMNELVKKIGLEHTTFKNVTGLDEKGHSSTADEIRELLIYALGNSLFKEIYTTKKYKLSNGLTINTTLKLYDKNGTIDTSFIIGSKTGFTDNAGYCLAYLLDVNGHDIIIISLKANRVGNNVYSLIDATKLVKFLRNNYQEEILVEKNKLIKEIPVILSDIEKVSIYPSSDIKKYLPSDYNQNKIRIEYDGIEELSYKNHVGDKIGVISYYFDNELIKEEDAILNEKISINYLKLLKKYWYLIIIFVIFIISTMILIIGKKMKIKKRKILKTA